MQDEKKNVVRRFLLVNRAILKLTIGGFMRYIVSLLFLVMSQVGFVSAVHSESLEPSSAWPSEEESMLKLEEKTSVTNSTLPKKCLLSISESNRDHKFYVWLSTMEDTRSVGIQTIYLDQIPEPLETLSEAREEGRKFINNYIKLGVCDRVYMTKTFLYKKLEKK